MLFFSSNPHRKNNKILQEARKTLQFAHKIYRYRCDLLSKEEQEAWQTALDQLQAGIEARTSGSTEASPLSTSMAKVECLVREKGGTFYTKSTWSENVETFFVAMTLAIGIRFYFLQPFKIPTNSMYPTYHGMTYERYEVPEVAPGGIEGAFRKLLLWTKSYQIEASSTGHLLIPIALAHSNEGLGASLQVQSHRVTGKKLGILPTTYRQYLLFMEQTLEPLELRLPGEFVGFDALVREQFYPNAPDWRKAGIDTWEWVKQRIEQGEIIQIQGQYYLKPPQTFDRGQRILSFDILTGDALFVERFSYHFFKPKVGDSFVFRTGTIPGMEHRYSQFENQYYIKRLAGKEGDLLSIREGALYHGDQAVTTPSAFAKNAERDGAYEGYVPVGNLKSGKAFEVPDDSYYALGDNSDGSSDSRFWGPLPDKAVVGKATFIFYPFTSRWGAAQ